MSSNIDFRARKRKFMTVTMEDGKQYFLKAPSKSLFRSLCNLQKDMEEVDDPMQSYEEAENVLDLIMSNNMSGTPFKNSQSKEDDGIFDFDQMAAIIVAYKDFAEELLSDPN